MQRREEANRRAEKLLTGKGRPSDLDWLYLWLRARSHGIKSVRELGDLIGHANLRDKGQFVLNLEDLYAMTRFHFSRI